jgi:hypothetical protein
MLCVRLISEYFKNVCLICAVHQISFHLQHYFDSDRICSPDKVHNYIKSR